MVTTERDDTSTGDTANRLEEALLLDTARVEMVVRPVGAGSYRAAASTGWSEFERSGDGWRITQIDGVDPLADDATDRFSGVDAERAEQFPDHRANAYPYGRDQVAQLFDHASAPDLAVVRTAAFHVHGNLGEHGSIGAVQSRAAFIASGTGIAERGVVDHHIRNIDVAPTIAALLDVDPLDDGRLLGVQDGQVRTELLSGDGAQHVIAVLFDGLNANHLDDALAAGVVPTLARLIDDGVCLRHGTLASFPTVTLPNHTTLLTGAHPGHHGVLSNSWFDRATNTTPDLLEFQQMAIACDHLAEGVETLHEAIHRSDPAAFTGSTYEYADRGSDWSTFGEVRDGRRPSGVPRRGEPVPHMSEAFADDPKYLFQSRIDTASTQQAVAMIDPQGATEVTPVPTFLWVNFSLTDTAGHESGPHGDMARAGLIDSDARLAEILSAADRAGIADDLAVIVLADHGMELTDPAVDGHYRDTLSDHGLIDGEHYLDVDDGLIYVLDR